MQSLQTSPARMPDKTRAMHLSGFSVYFPSWTVCLYLEAIKIFSTKPAFTALPDSLARLLTINCTPYHHGLICTRTDNEM